MTTLSLKKNSAFSVIAAAALVCGCDSSSNGSGAVATPVVPATPPWQGYFSGEITTEGGGKLYGEALLTEDGLIRILIDPALPWDWVVALAENNSQFVGEVEVDGDRAEGNGLLIGQGCTSVSAGRFCESATQAQVVIDDGSPGKLHGEINFTDGTGSNSWVIEMSWPSENIYLRPTSPELLLGVYEEVLAEFVGDQPQDTVVRVDAAGQLFFQSASSGCIANGSLTPHLGGRVNVWDTTLTIENCSGTYQSLNGTFAGQATRTPGEVGWESGWLVMFLSTQSDSSSPVAMTFWGSRL